MKKILVGLGIIVILAIAYYLISPAFKVIEINEASPLDEFEKQMEEVKDIVVEKKEPMPSSPEIIYEGLFMESAHEVAGKAILVGTNDDKILRFENFETINGPDLHIYLSSDLEAKDYVDLGEIKATKGNINYEIPSNTDLEKYNKVLVWCEPFKVLFSYAELN